VQCQNSFPCCDFKYPLIEKLYTEINPRASRFKRLDRFLLSSYSGPPSLHLSSVTVVVALNLSPLLLFTSLCVGKEGCKLEEKRNKTMGLFLYIPFLDRPYSSILSCKLFPQCQGSELRSEVNKPGIRDYHTIS
jgi:hypothetical protein